MLMTDSTLFASPATNAVEDAQPIRVRLAPDRRAVARAGWTKLAGDVLHSMIRRITPRRRAHLTRRHAEA